MYLELYRKKTAQKATDLFLVSMLIIAHKSRIQERYYTIYIARRPAEIKKNLMH